MNIFAPIGRAFFALLAQIGRLTLFTANAVASCVMPPIYWYQLMRQLMLIGYFSLPVVGPSDAPSSRCSPRSDG